MSEKGQEKKFDSEGHEILEPNEEDVDRLPHSYFDVPSGNPVEVVLRDEWGADPPLSKEFLCTPVHYVMLFDTGTDACETEESCKKAVKEMQRFYVKEKGLTDIPWNFLIGGDGKVYEGRGWVANAVKLSPKYEKYNGESMDFAYIGTYKDKSPANELTTAANHLITLGMDKEIIDMEFEMVSGILEDFVEKENP